VAAAVQNLAVSSWIGRKPFKWPEIGRELGNACLLVIVNEMMYTLWKQFIGAILDDFLGTRFTKNAILSTWKMKRGFFCETCRNLCSTTLLAIPQWTHVPNLGTFRQTMSWMWAKHYSFILKAMNVRSW
jgi:hypothetical protein